MNEENMKKKLKKFSIKFGIIFFVLLALLTYFSSTIDHMLLPQVKVTEIYEGFINEDEIRTDSRYLIPLSAVVDLGDSYAVFVIKTDEKGNSTVEEVRIDVTNQDSLYYEAVSDQIFSGTIVVYSTSKDIADGDRVYIEER